VPYCSLRSFRLLDRSFAQLLHSGLRYFPPLAGEKQFSFSINLHLLHFFTHYKSKFDTYVEGDILKTFAQYLKEMSLSSYRTVLSPPNTGEEGFTSDTKKVSKGTHIGTQVVNPGRYEDEITGRFSNKDKAVLSHPKTFKTLEDRLSNSNYNFNILMIETATNQRYIGVLDDYKNDVDKYIKSQGIVTQNHITFVKNGTSGHVLTPWMILHTLGHAVVDYIGEDTKIVELVRAIMYQLDKASIFHFKSAKESEIYNNTNELVHELIAEFLWHGGRIRINPVFANNEDIKTKVATIESRIKTTLDYCVGQIVYDFYV